MYTSIDLSTLRDPNFKSSPSPKPSHRAEKSFIGRWEVCFAICYLAGAVFGAYLTRDLPAEFNDGLITIFSNFLQARADQSLRQTVVFSLGQIIFPLGFLFFLGFCAISLPFYPVTFFFMGLGSGVSLAAAVAEDAAGNLALWKALLIMAPFAIGCALVAIVAAGCSIRLSLQCIRQLQGTGGGKALNIAAYLREFGELLLVGCFLACCNGLLTQLLL